MSNLENEIFLHFFCWFTSFFIFVPFIFILTISFSERPHFSHLIFELYFCISRPSKFNFLGSLYYIMFWSVKYTHFMPKTRVLKVVSATFLLDCFIYLKESTYIWNKKKCFLFHFESFFRSWDNQILTFEIFKCHDVIKCLSMKQEIHVAE